ncbi:hypothetical protein [Pseudomonas protegens]|uniref:hypothetical protein n=1 Tax=Pseudomonas protegens TaxID=380021 RepID=UPI0021CD08C2|nr:hypothetical protein [Pseudomonas protegens]
MSAAAYPRRRVFMAFFFCPLVLGLVFGAFKFVTLLAHLASNPRLLGEVRGGELLLMPVLAPLVAQVAFLLPFLVFALGVTLLKVYHSPRACAVLALVGASVASLWALIFIALVVHGVKKAQFADYQVEMLVLFVAACLTCWLAASLFLPESNAGPGVAD